MIPRANTERREIHVTSVFDIETESWDIPVLCGQYLAEGGYRETRKIAELADWLLEPGWHWAHNGGRFDALAVLDVWRAQGRTCTALFAGGRIIALKCGASTLCDSAALWPCTLREITTGQTNAKEELPWKCNCGDDCGGYCHIRRGMSKADFRTLSQYLRADCVSLFDALASLMDFADAQDIDLSLTLGASAFAHAQRMLAVERDKHSLLEHAFRRGSYYGGRVQSFFIGDTGPGFDLDIVSMYPSMLAKLAMPTGPAHSVTGADAARAFDASKPGIYTVALSVSESFIPPLPYRTKKRLWYPFGSWEATYTEPELRNALSYGAKINAFGEARIYHAAENIFAPWVEYLIALRFSVGKKTPMGTFLKLFLNSLYGKLAARPEKLRMLINPERIQAGDTPIHDGVYTRQGMMVDACAHPIWAAYVTAAGRCELLSKLHEGGAENTLYCDTDGQLSRIQRPLRNGSKLGEWEAKPNFSNARILAPKTYGLEYEPGKRVENGADILIDSRAKGIRLKRTQMPEAGREYKLARGVKGARSIGRVMNGEKQTRFFERQNSTRTLTARAGDRVLLADGKHTRAPHISECEE